MGVIKGFRNYMKPLGVGGYLASLAHNCPWAYALLLYLLPNDPLEPPQPSEAFYENFMSKLCLLGQETSAPGLRLNGHL